ncbi:MAG: DUF2279 domain-containing protein [Saprospiraceae bacterium]
MPNYRIVLLFLVLYPYAGSLVAQPLLSLAPADSLHRGRFALAAGGGALTYGVSMVGLNKSWYADYPSGRFHTFDDFPEWNQMDKMGHFLMSYQESKWVAGGARWVGMNPKAAAWTGFAGGQLIQTSFEILDGYSTQWGFSWSDVGFNLLGSGLYLGQELGWSDQRICLKMSALPVQYSNELILASDGVHTTTLSERADALYGTGPVNLFLRNYNTLVVWASVNPASFLDQRPVWLPDCLNIAVGMGANNLYGGRENRWLVDADCAGPDCAFYAPDPGAFPRERQFFLSFDIDLSRIKTRNLFLRTLLQTVNILKVPAPALELRSNGYSKFHFVYF